MSESVSDYQSSESNQSEQASKKFWSEEVRRQNYARITGMYVCASSRARRSRAHAHAW